MDAIFTLLSLLFFFSILMIPVVFIKPSIFNKLFKTAFGRFQSAGLTVLLSLTLMFASLPFVPETEDSPTITTTSHPTEEPAPVMATSSEEDVLEPLATETDIAQNKEVLTGPNQNKEALTEHIKDTENSRNEEEEDGSDINLHEVVQVVDGDTIKVSSNGELQTVRLIGIDTPENSYSNQPSQCYGDEATAYTTARLLGKEVRLEADPTQGDEDIYDRLLRFVFVDEANFNEEIIREGYAYEFTYASAYKYQSAFKAAEREAQANNRGLWGDLDCEDGEDAPVTEQEAAQENATTSEPGCYCKNNTYNCSDFLTHREAQTFFECCMSAVGYDIHRLDGDENGLACEALP